MKLKLKKRKKSLVRKTLDKIQRAKDKGVLIHRDTELLGSLRWLVDYFKFNKKRNKRTDAMFREQMEEVVRHYAQDCVLNAPESFETRETGNLTITALPIRKMVVMTYQGLKQGKD